MEKEDENELNELKAEMLGQCLILGGGTDADAQSGKILVRKCIKDVGFEVSDIYGEELDANSECISNCENFTLYYFRRNGSKEELLCKVKREAEFTHFFYMDTMASGISYYASIGCNSDFYIQLNLQ